MVPRKRATKSQQRKYQYIKNNASDSIFDGFFVFFFLVCQQKRNIYKWNETFHLVSIHSKKAWKKFHPQTLQSEHLRREVIKNILTALSASSSNFSTIRQRRWKIEEIFLQKFNGNFPTFFIS